MTWTVALHGCGGDDAPETPVTDAGVVPDATLTDTRPPDDTGVVVVTDTGTDAKPLDTGIDTGKDAGPVFSNPALAVANVDTAGSVSASLHVGTSWYIGGLFNRASQFPVANFVGISTAAGAGNAAPIPCPVGGGFNGQVNAIAQTATAIYVGGAFTTYQGQSANRLAKIDPVTCTLDTTFNPAAGNGFTDGGAVNAIALNGTDIYVGGAFTAYKGAANSANRIAKLDATTGAIDTTFSPTGAANANGFTDGGAVNTLAVNATDVYVGGAFTAYKGIASSANRIAKLDVATGVIDTTFSPPGANANGFNDIVSVIAINPTNIYVGGSFTTYKNVANSASRIAKLALGTGVIDTAFSPPGATANGFDAQVFSLALSATDVYAGGAFTAYKGVATSANKIAKLSLATGAIDTVFSPVGVNLNGFDGNVQTLALTPVTSTDLYVGGAFSTYKATNPRSRLAKLNATTGAIDLTFIPAGNVANGFSGGGSGGTTLVTSAVFQGTTLWLGGRFSLYSGTPVNNIVKLDDVTFVLDTTFSPTVNGFNDQVLALASVGTSLYAGGDFTSYRGLVGSANRVAKLDLTTGAIDTTFSVVGLNGFDARVRALAADGTDLYAGGDFTAYKGIATSANRIAKLNATTGAIDTAFSPVGANTNGFNNSVNALAVNATDVYAGGNFTLYKNVNNSANRIAKLNRTTGAIDTTFSPAVANGNGFTDGQPVTAIAINATDVYAGGGFTAYKGGASSAIRIAKLNLTTGVLDTTFSPPGAGNNGFTDGQPVSTITLGAGGVYVGGNFTAYRGVATSANRLAKLDLATGAIDAAFSPVGVGANGFDGAVNVVAIGTSACAGCDPVLVAGGAFTTYRVGIARGFALIDPMTGANK